MTKNSAIMTVCDNYVTMIKTNLRKHNTMSKLQSQKRQDNFKRMVAFHGVLFITITHVNRYPTVSLSRLAYGYQLFDRYFKRCS